MEKAVAPHSSTLAWNVPWMEEPGGLQSVGRKESDTTEWLPFHFSLSCTGEGNGNPLQCSCLENPRDGGAWWAAIYGVAQSQTQLKWLSSSSSMDMSIPISQVITSSSSHLYPPPLAEFLWILGSASPLLKEQKAIWIFIRIALTLSVVLKNSAILTM